MSATEKSLCLVDVCTHAGQEQASRSKTDENSTTSPSNGICTLDGAVEGACAEDGLLYCCLPTVVDEKGWEKGWAFVSDAHFLGEDFDYTFQSHNSIISK